MGRTREPVFSRGALTDWLLGFLKPSLSPFEILVGDHIAPPEAGWTGVNVGDGEYRPYVVLGTLAGTRESAATVASPAEDDWRLRYRLSCYGGVRAQTDWVADLVRGTWCAIPNQRLPLGSNPDQPALSWKIYRPEVLTMGALERSDSTNPPSWSLQDEVSIRVTR